MRTRHGGTDAATGRWRRHYAFEHLDALMEAAGIDVLLATSKHNVGYLIGGHRFAFFSAMDAIGHSRYLPVLAYERGRPERAAYFGNRIEGEIHAATPFWMDHVETVAWSAWEALDGAAAWLKGRGLGGARIGIEMPFMPLDMGRRLAGALPHATLHEATGVLERLRMRKSAAELALLREGSLAVLEAMRAGVAASGEGTTRQQMERRVRGEITGRGLNYGYCLLTMGASDNRAVFPHSWAPGETLSLDSGADNEGYIADVCRMGTLGPPDAELVDALGMVRDIQRAAIGCIAPGGTGGHAVRTAFDAIERTRAGGPIDFSAHGMGLVSHEAPFLMTNHPVTYAGKDADLPFEPGMVLSIETMLRHPAHGLVKLEDTVAVTADGHEMFGDTQSEWMVAEA